MQNLHILNGLLKGKAFPLTEDEYYLGRSRENDIQVEGISVSRKHARIVRKEGGFFIEDLDSKNGIFINSEKIQPGKEYEVKKGQLISLGRIAISIIEDFSDNNHSLMETIGFPEEMTEDELSLLNAMDINSLVSGKDESVLQDRVQTAEKNVELIYKVSNILLQTLENNENVNVILDKILNYILDLLKRIDRGAFILIDEDTREVTKIVPITKKGAHDPSRTYSRTIVDKVINEHRPVIMLDTMNEDEADLSESIVSMNIRSVLCIPMISNSKVQGVIYVDSLNRPYGFRSEDLFLLNALSIPAALAIEKASF